ncbi:MAG TPA: hypothetical protein VN445_11225 [Rectinemataceae bacterium]|nr:hypothetical protein [Rectinemataceae bacterium]
MRKARGAILLALVLATAATRATGQSTLTSTNRPVSQESIPLASPVYDEMDALYLIAEYGTASNARPWTKTEANLILGRIDRASLKAAALALYDHLAATIAPGLRFSLGKDFQFGVAFDMAFETYLHRNSTDYDTEEDWIYGAEERKPMAKLRLDFSVGDFFYTYCDLQYGKNRFSDLDGIQTVTSLYADGIGAIVSSSNTTAHIVASDSAVFGPTFATNFLERSYYVDFITPKRAIAAVGGANWNFSFARDRIGWGNGHTGNFIVGSQGDYQDYAQFTAFADRFKYQWLNIFLETNPSSGGDPDIKFRLFMAHRLEFRVLRTLTFAVSEDIMYQNDVFDLRYLNPAFIYHNLNNRSMFNAIAHAELEFSPIKGLNFYGQFVLDQARAPNEDASQSDAMGWMGGIEYAAPVGPGFLASSLEFALTSPLLYRRDLIDFLMFRKYDTNGAGNILAIDYLGYRYGGDAMVLQWDTAWRVPDAGRLGLRLFGMRHGEVYYYKAVNTGYSGDIVDETFVASLTGEYELKSLLKWPAASAWAELDWILKRSYMKSTDSYSSASADLQLTAGISLSL